MGEFFKLDRDKYDELKQLKILESQLQDSVEESDDCQSAINDEARLISEKTTEYVKRKAAADVRITAIKGSIQALNDKIQIDSNYTATEKQEFTDSVNNL